jgi:hypothetical protein
MTRNKTPALLLTVWFVLCGVVLANYAPRAMAQSASSAAPQSKPVIKSQFLVERMMNQAIQVRDIAAVPALHTFTYSPEIRDKMQKIFNEGGYQYGDKIVVWYQSGSSLALNIKGKPSKKK